MKANSTNSKTVIFTDSSEKKTTVKKDFLDIDQLLIDEEKQSPEENLVNFSMLDLDIIGAAKKPSKKAKDDDEEEEDVDIDIDEDEDFEFEDEDFEDDLDFLDDDDDDDFDDDFF